MAKYGVIDSSNMASTYRGDVHIYDAVSTENIENGTVGYITPTDTSEGVIYNFYKGTKDITDTSIIVIVDDPAWNYDTTRITNQRLDNFIIEAGNVFRVREIDKRDVFALNDACFESDVVAKLSTGIVGGSLKIAEDSTTGKFSLSSDTAVTLDSDSKLVVAVENKRTVGGLITSNANSRGYVRDMYELRVVSVG